MYQRYPKNKVDLSFSDLKEYERTKHVHRLHPYLGKFIPQLVNFFLTKYFKFGDIIIDPFVGSGTTMNVALSLGNPAIGIEINPEFCRYILSTL